MTGRDALTAEVQDRFINHASPEVRRWSERHHIFYGLDLMSEGTLSRMADVIQHPAYGEYTAIRLMMLFATRQHKRLERVVRNILLFADIEAEYRPAFGIEKDGWKVFHPIESKARELVYGKQLVVESPEQGEAIRAAFHGVMALVAHQLRVHGETYLQRYTAMFAWMEIDKLDIKPMVQFFAAHPESARALHAYVVERGFVGPEVLQQVVDSQSALSMGVL